MSSALLDRAARRGDCGPRQRPLFDELRRGRPGPDPSGPTPRPGEARPATARGERTPRSGGSRLTLESHLERTWEGLLAAGAAECPVCRATMATEDGRGACGGCGARLS